MSDDMMRDEGSVPAEEGAVVPARRRPVRRRRMHEDLVDMLAQDIREGVFKVGEALPSERNLMQEFNVSRLTVREATAALESAGLIETRPGSRARVRAPGPEFLLEMLSQAATFYLQQPGGLQTFTEVRQLVETGIVRLAAARATPAQIEELRERLERNHATIDDTEAFGRTDIEFHSAIAAIADNPIINAFFVAVDNWLREVRNTTLRVKGQTDTAFKAHRAIFEAIEARDPGRAAEAMRAHLQQLEEVYPLGEALGQRQDQKQDQGA